MPVDNLCIQCGERPRKISKSGKQLTMCADCQRAYWRKKKRQSGGQKKKVVRQRTAVYRDQPQQRKCKVCKTTKPIAEFRPWGMTYRRTCKQCEDIPAHPEAKGEHILLVNGDHIVLAQVISQKPDAHNTDRIVEFYQQQGYRIEHVFEKEKIS